LGASGSPVTLSPTNGRVVDVAHIYFNIATGERVATAVGGGETIGRGLADSYPVWSSLVSNPCAEFGYTTEWFYGVDNNANTTSLATDITVLDFGDIAVDTVVDMVHINWVTGHADTDSDSDGVGDGVVGLAGEWTYWDADNGRDDNLIRLPLISFMIVDLPGNILGPEALSGYSASIDLAGLFSDSMTFEIGDTDGDSQGAAFYNPGQWNEDNNFDGFPDTDLDQDGLFDWAWSVRFAQPGTRDLDGDGIIDGDFADSMQPIGISFGVGEGEAIDDGDGTWAWELDMVPPGATGQEDAFAIYAPPLGGVGGPILYAGFFWFGGFACEGISYTPVASFEHVLYGPGSGSHCCPGDINCDGIANFFDISEFLVFFVAGDMQADFNGDGVLSHFDISAFLAAFAAGCP